MVSGIMKTKTMRTAAVLAAITMNFGALFAGQQPAVPTTTCHIRVVSHKFVGAPATVFSYAGDQYSIPPTGWIELIAEKGADTYEFNGRALPLNIFPLDDFGTETISVPRMSAFKATPAGETASR
jgi:hypothetical protein